MSLAILVLAGALACRRMEAPAGTGEAAAGLPLLGTWDFEGGDTGGWQPKDSSAWQVVESAGSMVFELTGPGEPGPVRAPLSWAILPRYDLASFELTGRMMSGADPANPHRDLCVFFHFQDPVHFYYVHFSASSDGAHNIIGLVAAADRVKVNREPAGESRAGLVDREWHTFKITFDGGSGEIAAYLDDMETPILTAGDAVLRHGFVGIGSFDDAGMFDDISLKGRIFREDAESQ